MFLDDNDGAAQAPKFARVMQALKPDVINLQEIYDHTAAQTVDVFNTILPLPGGASWYGHQGFDNVIISKYPLLEKRTNTFPAAPSTSTAIALVDLPDAWSESAKKFRTPQDWLVAVMRAFGVTDVRENVMPLLRQLRHPLWSPQAPKGFGDTTQEWADPDSLLNRAELARTIARRLSGPRIDPRSLVDVVDVPAGDPLHGFLRDNSIPADERLALALAGPAFQWR
jgi:hypothetical protein